MSLRTFAILWIATAVLAGGSIVYLTHVAESAGRSYDEYPALPNTMSGDYAHLTRNLIDHGVFSRSTTTPYEPDAWRTPGYPAFLVPFYLTFGSFYPALFAQILVLFATVVLVYLMAKKVLGGRYALPLALLYLLVPGTLISVSTLMTETVFVFLFILAVYLCFFGERRPYLRFALAGLALAAAAYVRPAGLYIVPFFVAAHLLFFVGWRAIRWPHLIRNGCLVLAFIAALLPWCYRNYVELGHFTFASTGSYVLFRQNAVQFYEAMYDIPNIEARYALQDMAGIPRGKVPETLEYSDTLRRVAVEVIASRPFEYAFFHLSTFIPFFGSSGAIIYERYVHDLTPGYNPPEEPSLLQAIHPFSVPLVLTVLKNHGWTLIENVFWGLATLLVLVGLLWSKDVRIARVFFVLMLYFALVTGPIAHARYRVPVDPLILISALSAAVYLLEWRKKSTLLAKQA